MKIERYHSYTKLLLQYVLLGVPTVFIAAYFIFSGNQAYLILENKWILQTFFFSAGLLLSFLFYSFRFRFITTFILLLIFGYLLYTVSENLVIGEFDTIKLLNKILLFNTLFITGWFVAYGLSRSKYFSIIWSVLLLTVQTIVISKLTNFNTFQIILNLAPIIVYALYIIFISEFIRNYSQDDKKIIPFIIKRVAGFVLLTSAILFIVFSIFKKDFKIIEKEWGQAQAQYDEDKKGSESMTKENKDGTLQNKDQTQLTGSLSKNKRLVFVAHLDNFFDDSQTPNPLYFTSTYYSKFDTLTQTFEIDENMPDNDLFKPNPSKIPLYFAKTDSSVIKKSKGFLKRKVVSADVYSVLLSPDEFVAPSTAFFCQPISIDKENKNQYKSAYKTKMWVSELNSAYFVYNPSNNFSLKLFQQERFNELRKVESFASVEKKFYNYYTFMPSNNDYKKIKDLSVKITAGKTSYIDKIIAIRDYFLSVDSLGQPNYKYTDNPGIPGMPSASKLNYFLFENKKGYCAYFAGATLFMLRSLGIPARVTAGFLTVDRSSKNPGWYWFYEDQAHAWVQVFFPGYGWIDFDTTIPDTNTQEAEQPDQTPPMNTQKAFFVANGKVLSIDTVSKKMKLSVEKLMYKDKDYPTSKPYEVDADISVATVIKDTGTASLAMIKKGMNVVAVSFAEIFRELDMLETDSFLQVLSKMPREIPIDELKIMDTDEEKKMKTNNQQFEKTNWLHVLKIIFWVILSLIIFLFSLPFLIWKFYQLKANKSNHLKAKSYYTYRACMFYLNQLGNVFQYQSINDYANQIDIKHQTNFTHFINNYQQIKYSSLNNTTIKPQEIQELMNVFLKKIKSKYSIKNRVTSFLNLNRTILYFSKPKIN